MHYDTVMLVGITMGLVELIKMTDLIPDRFVPLLTLVLGTVLGMTSHYDLISSLMIPLTGMGLYRGFKVTVRGA